MASQNFAGAACPLDPFPSVWTGDFAKFYFSVVFMLCLPTLWLIHSDCHSFIIDYSKKSYETDQT